MFAARVIRFIPVVANPQLLVAAWCWNACAPPSRGLVSTPWWSMPATRLAPSELAAFDLAEGIEDLSRQVRYMPARGCPCVMWMRAAHAATLLDALADASPQSDVILIHASASELVRIFGHQAGPPICVPCCFCNDMAEGLTDAYGAIKVIVQRGHWLAYDLVVCASARSKQADEVARRLAHCADNFLGAASQPATGPTRILRPRSQR